jgi:hypothetical protein
LHLAEGTRVEVTVISTEAKPKDKTSRQILAEIAAMPLEVSNVEEEFRSQNGLNPS